MSIDEKLDVIRNYFKEKFPKEIVADRFSDEYMAQYFYIMGENKGIYFRRAFLQDHTVEQILRFLKEKDPARGLDKAGLHFFVENDGSIKPKTN